MYIMSREYAHGVVVCFSFQFWYVKVIGHGGIHMT